MYVLPANSFNPAVTGTTIESSSWNATANDLAAAMTQSLSSDGQTTMTGNLPMGNNKLTGLADGAASTDSITYGQAAKLAGGNTFTAAQTIATSAATALTLQQNDDGANVGPIEDLYRNSATPAANDAVGGVQWSAQNSAAAKTTLGRIFGRFIDPTSTSEDFEIGIQTIIAGALAERLTLGAGLYTTGTTGGDKGVGTLNINALYLSGALFYEIGTFTPGVTVNGSATGITGTFSGRYTKNGNIVTARIRGILTSNGAGTGAVAVTGLPYTAAGGNAMAAVLETILGFASMTGAPMANVNSGGTTVDLYQASATGRTALTDTNVTDTASFSILVVYET